jgi:methyltransferase (TIGR00027 family)
MMAKIEHVSDTALMVAACRALETERPDGFIRDPYAANLAGARGMSIARHASAVEWMCFGVGVRGRFIDELLIRALVQGEIKTVVNLGAGLDTRPWRLDLSAGLRWIEVDFKDMLDYKSERLGGQRPKCAMERIAADLSIPSDRERVFRAVGNRAALVITEGLLMYLSHQALAALFSEAVTKSGARRWIFDVSSKELMQRAHGNMLREIESVRADDHLTGRQIIDVALAQGWRTSEFRSYARDAIKIAQGRILKLVVSMGRLPEAPPESDPSGVYLLTYRS